MSEPNLDQSEADWQELLCAAVVDPSPPDRLGMIGTWAEAEDGWHHRRGSGVEVRVPSGPALGRLAEELAAGISPAAEEAERAIAAMVGRVRLSGEKTTWAAARELVRARLTHAVGAVALGGVRSAASHAEGAAALAIGEHVLVGHLDDGIHDAVAAFARRHGLPGYRITEDSWWAEYLYYEEEADAHERMEGLEAEGSWPWLGLFCATRASGGYAEEATVATAQALLGALVLLDEPPGAGHLETVPFIAGGLGPAMDTRSPGDRERDYTLPIAAQHLDAMSRRLDNAEVTPRWRPSRVIEISRHVHGPAGPLLVDVVESSLGHPGASGERLARAARLAWLAFATETASTASALVRAALAELAADASEEELRERAEAGMAWRLAQDAAWPPGERAAPRPEFEGGPSTSEAVAAMGEEQAEPSWGAEGAAQAGAVLAVLQAVFFGVASER
jgi:hypothetical protein